MENNNFVKNTLSLFLVLVVLFSISSCNNNPSSINSSINQIKNSNNPQLHLGIIVYQFGNCSSVQPNAHVIIIDQSTNQKLGDGYTDSNGFYGISITGGTIYSVHVYYDDKLQELCDQVMPQTDVDHHICIYNQKC